MPTETWELQLDDRKGEPNRNACIECVNRTYREEVLNGRGFEPSDGVRRTTDDWLARYNHHQPHESLGNRLQR